MQHLPILLLACLVVPLLGVEHLIVGVGDFDYLPHCGVDAAGEATGFARDLLDAFARDQGFDLEYRPLPVSLLCQAFLAGEVDLKYPEHPLWRPEAKLGRTIAYSRPVIGFTDATFTVPGAPAPTTLGRLRGFTAPPWGPAIATNAIKVREFTSVADLLDAAAAPAGGVDAVYGNLDVLAPRLAARGSPLTLAADLPACTSSYHLASATRPDMVARFDAWLVAQPRRRQVIAARHGLDHRLPPAVDATGAATAAPTKDTP